MAKKQETAPEMVTAAVETPATPPPPVEAAAPAAIVPAATVSPDFTAKKALAARLPPELSNRVLLLKRPSVDDLMKIVMALPQENQEAMLTLVSKTNPEKQGLHSAATGFESTSLKVYHGVGTDPARPKQTLGGQFYSGDSRIIGEKFNAVPLAIYEGRILWPQKDPAGGNESKAPICVSMDRKTGSKYGDCAKCALADREYTKGGCMLEVTAYLLDSDMTSIYELKFSKTSFGAGSSLIKVLKKANNIWDRWFTFEAKERVDGGKKWYVVQSSPLVDPKSPDKTNTPKEFHALFSALSKVIDSDIYYPALADIHDRVKNAGSESAAPVAAEAFDEKAFLKGDTEAVPDYSKDV